MKSKARGVCLTVVMVAGLLISCTTTIPETHNGVRSPLVEKEYEVLGRVEIMGTTKYIMGFNTGGGASYSYLMHKAAKDYGADDVINITKDFAGVIGWWPFYYEYGHILTGLAIKYQ